MADASTLVIPAGPLPGSEEERAQAEALAKRYRAEFVDLKHFKIQHDLLRTVPVELMFRYNFVPIEQQGEALVIAVSDPSRLMVLDEIAGLLGHRIIARVATLSQITDLLKKTEQSQRVLDEASEGLTFDVLTGDDNADENISIEKLTSDEDISPIIRLVDTTIFTALERRASDIHIETYDDSLHVKYRIDGVLQEAMAPIAREHHTTILSRIKIMSELDIAERRVPQDGRFRVRYKGRLIDFRVSIMPTVHGENAVLRVLDKESMSEKFRHLTLDVVGFADEDLRRFRRYIREPYGMVLVTGPTGSGKTTTLYAALNEIKSDEDKIITIEDPVEYQIRGITQIPVNEKEGPDVCARASLDFAPRSGQDSCGRNSRPGDSADCNQLGAHGTSCIYDGARQQRSGRSGALFEHGGGGVQLCVGAELHSGAAVGKNDLRALCADGEP